ncbi:uncharacterized protein YecE (DUF72 family) [Pseudomonas graminis]|uniref:DUF72 domain-containing protein n=1 Tax=Pseudomonas graminis TaxID=158627 RepID=UPI0010D2192F|nr:DUF72 domain-containing protein [Pseudomonas graminis]TDV56690.1 uncharacterized protein YecE (DUF72 family) [Pseudomonas graminis]
MNDAVLDGALSKKPGRIFVGCAGWSLAREHAPAFPGDGTHLERYARQFNTAEINSSFYRPHRPQTYARWADSVPADFRFSVKIPKLISHEQRLQDSDQALDEFLGQCGELGERLGCLLLQLPPSLAFEPRAAEVFFTRLRQRFAGQVVIEPRHGSWVQGEPMLTHYRVAQAGVDPSRLSNDSQPSGWPGLSYRRLHGAPRIYYSAYEEDYLIRLAAELKAESQSGAPTWCIFDNTASGAATGNALRLIELLGQ